jgi:hypothetical protein
VKWTEEVEDAREKRERYTGTQFSSRSMNARNYLFDLEVDEDYKMDLIETRCKDVNWFE